MICVFISPGLSEKVVKTVKIWFPKLQVGGSTLLSSEIVTKLNGLSKFRILKNFVNTFEDFLSIINLSNRTKQKTMSDNAISRLLNKMLIYEIIVASDFNWTTKQESITNDCRVRWLCPPPDGRNDRKLKNNTILSSGFQSLCWLMRVSVEGI